MKNAFISLILISGLLPQIQGQIIDIDSRDPIQGVNVYVEGVDAGTQTDENGFFYIQSNFALIKPGLDKIKISHIAYLDEERVIDDSRFYLFFLQPSVIDFEELIVTGTRTLKTFKDSPILTRVISAQEIKNSQSRDLYDIMNEIFPGYQRLKGQHSMSNEIRFNGLGTKSILFMVDGQKINAEYGGNMDLSVIDINNIDKIEYVDGAISTLYGSGAMGGAINVITKKANERSYNLNISLFSDAPSIKSGHISYSKDWGIVDAGISATLNESDGFDLKEIEYVNDNDRVQKHQEEFSNLILSSKLNFNLNDISLRISHDNYSSAINTYKMDDLGDGPFADLSIVPEFELPRNYSARTAFKLKSKVDLNTLIDYSFSIEDYEKKYKYTGFQEQLWSGSYSKNHTLIISKLYSDMSFLFGVDNVRDEYKSFSIDGNNNGEYDELSIFEDGSSRKTNQRSLFINSEWMIKSVNFASGLRYQYHDIYKGDVIPMLSIYKKYEKYKLRGTWSQGYRAPNLKELYYKWDHPGGQVTGNPNLQPEQSEYISISLESFKDFYYSINVYYKSLKNMIDYVTDDNNNHTYTNFEKVSLKGFNIFYKRKLSGRGELSFSYNYLDAYDHILNARLNGSNLHNLNTKLTYFILDNLKAQVSLKYSSPKKYTNCVQSCGDDPSDDIFELSSFYLADFSARYDFSKNISATIGVNNLFDYRDSNASSEQFLTLLSPGRTLFFSFDYNLRGASEK